MGDNRIYPFFGNKYRELKKNSFVQKDVFPAAEYASQFRGGGITAYILALLQSVPDRTIHLFSLNNPAVAYVLIHRCKEEVDYRFSDLWLNAS